MAPWIFSKSKLELMIEAKGIQVTRRGGMETRPVSEDAAMRTFTDAEATVARHC
jgi:hypothetical protein